MEPFQIHTDELLVIHSWVNQYPDLVVGLTTKKNGNSPFPSESLNIAFHVGDELKNVQFNREKVGTLLNFPVAQWVGAEQVHDVHIETVTQSDRGKGAFTKGDWIPNTDGLITKDLGVLLTLCYADCVPLYFLDPETKWIGTAHAGWKGTTGNIAGKMVESLRSHGVALENLQVAIGPSICRSCYIVDDRVIQAVEVLLEEKDKKPYNEIEPGQYQLDLKAFNILLLKKAGVKETNIQTTDYCSSCDEDQFFSHRRDQGKTGRMASFIGWKE